MPKVARTLTAALATLAFAFGCSSPSTEADASTDGGADAADAADGGGLGFTPSNIGAIDFAAIGPIGDLVLSDCGPQIRTGTTPRAGCDDPGKDYQAFERVQGDGSKVMVFVARNITIPANAQTRVFGDVPVVLVAQDTLRIEGSILAAANNTQGVAGGFEPSSGPDSDGRGPGGGKRRASSGGGGYCGAGGKGGGSDAGLGGTPYGTPELSPLLAGSSGGGQYGGAGGGALQLVAGRLIEIRNNAVVNVGGGGGGAGRGGGGSGGALLLEAPEVKVAGRIAANGGGGGGLGGEGGSNANDDSNPALGATDAKANGGNGGAGTTLAGADGTTNADFPDGRLSGQGGGGVGRIRVHTREGALVLEATASISPALETACATQGTLRP